MSIRIIGNGAMGGAIARVLSENGKEVSLYDKHRERAEALSQEISARVCSAPLEGHYPDEILLLAFKPQDFHTSVEEIKDFGGKLIVSILAGITTDQLKEAFPSTPVLRMIPNLAVRYGDGIVALAEDSSLLSLQDEIEEIFAPLGLVRWIPESKCDALTALSGSGPAFLFSMIDAMVDAAIAIGFTAEEGYELIKQMMGGSLTTLYESNHLPSQLKWKVTSPSGSTIAGLRAFESHAVRSGIIETFIAAYNRAQELGKKI
ncbi:MAG: pyrroline-5-carboxylate reductase [Chlamydiales bacterium]|nr:pyrroline-5-carboxylate reductase [Chlamydiales bacterium]